MPPVSSRLGASSQEMGIQTPGTAFDRTTVSKLIVLGALTRSYALTVGVRALQVRLSASHSALIVLHFLLRFSGSTTESKIVNPRSKPGFMEKVSKMGQTCVRVLV